METNEEVFSNLDEEAFDLISVMSDSMELKNVKRAYQTEKGGINMCRAIKEMIEEGKAEGRAEGRAEGIAEGRAEGTVEGIQLVVTIVRMKEKGMCAEEISRKCSASLDQVIKILDELAA